MLSYLVCGSVTCQVWYGDQNRINVNKLVGTHQRLVCIVTYSLVVTCDPED